MEKNGDSRIFHEESLPLSRNISVKLWCSGLNGLVTYICTCTSMHTWYDNLDKLKAL